MNHEEGVVKFVVPRKQERYLEFLSTPKGRKKFVAELAHFKSLDPLCLVTIPPNESNPASVARLLAARCGSKTCWVISEDPRLDGREMELREALSETMGRQMGTFLSCIPGKLAYFEDEDGRWILER